MRWTEYGRTVLSEIAHGSSDALKHSVNRIPAQAINWKVGLVLMWIGRGAALSVAICALGIRLFGEVDWWGGRSFFGIVALFFTQLNLAFALKPTPFQNSNGIQTCPTD